MYKVGYKIDGVGPLIPNKLKALDGANWNVNRLSFHWRENELDYYDAAVGFTKQPMEDFESLMLKRALKLRSEYRWLALWYTGGSDSQTILELFAKYNIPLDEIVFYNRTYNPYPQWDYEVQQIRNGQLWYQKINPRVKITELEVGYENALDFYNQYGEEWIYHPLAKNFERYSKSIRPHMCERNRRELDKPGVINITGMEKPRLILYDNKWYTCFFDSQESSEVNSPGFYSFFWNDLELYTKQCYMLINWYENRPDFDESFLHRVQSIECGDLYIEYCKAAGRVIPKSQFLAGGWSKHQADPNHIMYESKTQLSYIEKDQQHIHKIYKAGVKFMDDYGSGAYKKTMLSKQYFIKQYQPNVNSTLSRTLPGSTLLVP